MLVQFWQSSIGSIKALYDWSNCCFEKGIRIQAFLCWLDSGIQVLLRREIFVIGQIAILKWKPNVWLSNPGLFLASHYCSKSRTFIIDPVFILLWEADIRVSNAGSILALQYCSKVRIFIFGPIAILKWKSLFWLFKSGSILASQFCFRKSFFP